MKNKTLIWILSVLIAVAALFDIFSTIRFPHFTNLETNILFLGGLGIAGLLIVKLGVIAFLIFALAKIHKLKNPMNKYTLVYLILILIIAQTFAGVLNTRTQYRLADREGYDNPADVPKETIMKYQKTPKESMIFYFGLIVLPVTFFYIIGLLSFVITRKFEGDTE